MQKSDWINLAKGMIPGLGWFLTSHEEKLTMDVMIVYFMAYHLVVPGALIACMIKSLC